MADTAQCSNCAKRNQHYELVIMHPSVNGIGFCTKYVNDSSRLWFTPDDYWCGEYAPKPVDGEANNG